MSDPTFMADPTRLVIAAIVGILLNAILPGNDYEFDATAGSDAATSGNLQV